MAGDAFFSKCQRCVWNLARKRNVPARCHQCFSRCATPLFTTANEGDSRLRPTSDEALPPLEEGDLFNEEEHVRTWILIPQLSQMQKLWRRMSDELWGWWYVQAFMFGGDEVMLACSASGIHESAISEMLLFMNPENPFVEASIILDNFFPVERCRSRDCL